MARSVATHSKTMQVVDYETKDGRHKKGLSTHYMKALRPGDRVAACVVKTKFRLPEDPSVPVLLLSTGSGISPYLGFVEQRLRIHILLLLCLQVTPPKTNNKKVRK